MTLTIDLIDSDALSLLRDMERLKLIRVNPPEKTAFTPQDKLSERFAGALHLSAKAYAAFQTALQEGRAEWERDTLLPAIPVISKTSQGSNCSTPGNLKNKR